MFSILIVLCLILAPAFGNNVTAPEHGRRISKGVDTVIEDSPYQVSVRFYREHMVSGSILKDTVILTVAHVMQNAVNTDFMSIQYGLTTIGGVENIIGVRDYKCHPDYSGITGANDVCLLELKSPIPFGDAAKPVTLATEEPAPGTIAVVAGWGDVSEEGGKSSKLQKIEVEIMDRPACQEQATYIRITEEMLCTAVGEDGKGVCKGDSGGPLMVNGAQVGVTSFGQGCGQPNKPDVHANVPKLHSWITNTAEHFVSVRSSEYATMTTVQSEN